ncbi:unnamed protein product [Phytomonas sp. EM1]|nr:unnamed protein product [Phytomonas sp. EM1]|eukprot:CCW62273.1 unnamed protein product [Phytomonas sp. isolate EM1]
MERRIEEQIWNQCSKLLLPSKVSAWNLFDKYIRQPYLEPHRHYHNLNHIRALLMELEAYIQVRSSNSKGVSLCSSELSSQRWGDLAVVLAIFFHDAVYNPTSKVNEEDSVGLLRRFLSEAKDLWEGQTRHKGGNPPNDDSTPPVLWLDLPSVAYVEREAARFIMGTKNHFEPSSSSSPTSLSDLAIHPGSSEGTVVEEDLINPLHLVLDLDLTVFGSPWKGYVNYVEAIRMEYQFYSDITFMNARYDFIQHVLDQPRVFKTRYFYDKYERVAFENLKREQEEMRKAISAGRFYLSLN